MKSPDVLPLECGFGVGPTGRLMLLAQVPTLAPLRTLPLGEFLWVRWVDRSGLGEASIELVASSSPDEGAGNGRVLARAAVTEPRGTWALYRIAEVQGVVDFFVAGSDAPAGSPEAFLHLLASVYPCSSHGRAQSSSPPAQTSLAA